VVAVCILAALFVYNKYLLGPLRTDLDSKIKELSDTNDKINQLSRKAKMQKQLERQIEQLSIELKEAEKQLPRTTEVPNLIRYVMETTQVSGVKVLAFQPNPKSDKQYYSEIPIAWISRVVITRWPSSSIR